MSSLELPNIPFMNMGIESLKSLAQAYPPGNPDDLLELGRNYEKRREKEILDVAAVATDVSIDSLLNLGLEPEQNPALREAFELQYENVDPSSLVDYSEQSLGGFVNGVKGKYFEILVRDRLNSGENLGELSLAEGQQARLAESATQKGWDLKIVNEDGSINEYIQLKATKDMGYIREALDKYPGIRVATTSDIDGSAEEILRTHISTDEVTEVAKEQIEEMAEEPLTDAVHSMLEWGFDAVPLVPAIVIAVTEGHAVLAGRLSMGNALKRGAQRLKTGAAFSALGATLHAMGATGFISVPTTVAARIAWRRIQNRNVMVESLRLRTEALRVFANA